MPVPLVDWCAIHAFLMQQQILIVEDEMDIADLVMFDLQRAGYSILKAHDGIAGTEIAIRERPDLIILDIMLPGRDGYSVFREVREMPGHPIFR